jgi:hypothetical protein
MNITIVSGYWQVVNKHSHNKYDMWFNNSLKINQRYIFFCENNVQEYINQFRKEYETEYINYSLNNFYSKQFYRDNWIHPIHVPSKELGMIWHEKMHLLKIAKDYDKNNNKMTEFYVWCDAGVCVYRDNKPPSCKLNLRDINLLPRDKLCYSYVKEFCHNFAATVLILHNSIIDMFHDLFYKYLQLIGNEYNNWLCGSDQVIFTRLLKDFPDLFYKISDGYGNNLVKLYELC